MPASLASFRALRARAAFVVLLLFLSALARGDRTYLPGYLPDQDKYSNGIDPEGLHRQFIFEVPGDEWTDDEKFPTRWASTIAADVNNNFIQEATEDWDVTFNGVAGRWVLDGDNSCYAAAAANLVTYISGFTPYHRWMYEEGVWTPLSGTGRSFWNSGGDTIPDVLDWENWDNSVIWYDDGLGGWHDDPIDWMALRLERGKPIGGSYRAGLISGGHTFTIYGIDTDNEVLLTADSDSDGGGDTWWRPYRRRDGAVYPYYEVKTPGGNWVELFSLTCFETYMWHGSGGNWAESGRWSGEAGYDVYEIILDGVGQAVRVDSPGHYTSRLVLYGGQTNLALNPGSTLDLRTLMMRKQPGLYLDGGRLFVDHEAAIDGSVFLFSGEIFTDNYARIIIGCQENGFLEQHSGLVNIWRLALGDDVGGSGRYDLGGGVLRLAEGLVGDRGSGQLNVYSGAQLLPTTLPHDWVTAADTSIAAGGQTLSWGTIALYDGATMDIGSVRIGLAGVGVMVQESNATATIRRDIMLGELAGGNGQYTVAAGAFLSVGRDITAGKAGTGTFTQGQGVELDLSGTVMLGQEQGSDGTYQLAENAVLAAGNLVVGGTGLGEFRVDNGTTVIRQTLTVGRDAAPEDAKGAKTVGRDGAPGSGTLLLNGGLLQAANVIIGGAGLGEFRCDNGVTVINQTLTVGQDDVPGATSTVQLDEGLLQATNAVIGERGDARFSQNGGSVDIQNDLTLGRTPDREAEYVLESGDLTALSMTVGERRGVFVQRGGTAQTESLTIGRRGGPVLQYYGTYRLEAGGLSAGSLVLGDEQYSTGTLTQAGGTVDPGSVVVGRRGTGDLQLTRGDFAAAEVTVGETSEAYGTMQIEPAATFFADRLTVGRGGIGRVSHNGGTQTVAAELVLGDLAGSDGQYDLALGRLNATQATVGRSGFGQFTQEFGLLSTSLMLGRESEGVGICLALGGTIAANEAIIGHAGSGRLEVSGSEVTVDAAVRLGVVPGSTGVLEINRGLFAARDSTIQLGVQGTGILRLAQQDRPGDYSGELIADALLFSAGSRIEVGPSTDPVQVTVNRLDGQVGDLDLPLHLALGQPGGSRISDNTISAGQRWELGKLTVGYELESSLRIEAGGSLDVSQGIWLGESGAAGEIRLSGSLSSANQLYVGHSGPGTVNQAAGSATVSAVTVGDGDRGSYSLEDGLLRCVSSYVGTTARGVFLQSGGTHMVETTLWIGVGTGTGAYRLEGGDLSAHRLTIGSGGEGAMAQSGGTVTVPFVTVVSVAEANSVYDLVGGSLTTAALDVGEAGVDRARFLWDGGTLSPGHLRINPSGDMSIGQRLSGPQSWVLPANTEVAAGGMIDATGQDLLFMGAAYTKISGAVTARDLGTGVADDGTTDLFAGVVRVDTLTLGVDSGAQWLQSGGELLVASTIRVGHGGATGGLYVLDAGIIEAGAMQVGEGTHGRFEQNGGTASIGQLVVSQVWDRRGEVALASGADLRTQSTRVGLDGWGWFTQNGGAHTVRGDLVVGEGPCTEESHEYDLDGPSQIKDDSNGTLSTVRTVVGWGSDGLFMHYGGLHQASEAVLVGEDREDAEESRARYYLYGGALETPRLRIGTPAAFAHFRYCGGEVQVPQIEVNGGYAAFVLEADYARAGGTITVGAGGMLYAGTRTFTVDSGRIVLDDGILSDGTFRLHSSTTTAVLEGYGYAVNLADFENQGRVIADGKGTGQVLDLSDVAATSRTDLNPGDWGWFARRQGELKLPARTVPKLIYNLPWSGRLDLGDEPVDYDNYLINSLTLWLNGVRVAGTDTQFDASVLALDTDIPAGLEGRLLGLWRLSPPPGMTWTEADLAFRYDGAGLAGFGWSEAEYSTYIRTYQYVDDHWVDVSDSADEWFAYVEDASSLSLFAVVVSPDPGFTTSLVTRDLPPAYVPGADLEVTLVIDLSTATGVQGYTVTESLPPGVTFKDVVSGATALEVFEQDGDVIVSFPGDPSSRTVVYRVTVALGTAADLEFAGSIAYACVPAGDGTQPVAGDTVTTASGHTVTFGSGLHGALAGGSPNVTVEVVHGAPAPLAPVVTPEDGWTFSGWSPPLPATITADVETTAQYSRGAWTVTFQPGAHGTLAGGTPGVAVTVADGDPAPVPPDVTPEQGWTFTGWSPALPPAVTANTETTAQYARLTYTLSYVAGPNGAVVGPTPQTVNHGEDSAAVTAVPAPCYHFVRWSDTRGDSVRTDIRVTANLTVTAEFALNRCALFYAAGANGTVAGPTVQSVDCGSDGVAVTAVPAEGYDFVQWSDGSTANPRQDTTVTADQTVTADFADSTPPGVPLVTQDTGWVAGVTIHSVSNEFTGSGWDLQASHLVDGSGLSGAPPEHAQTAYPGGDSWQTSTTSGTGSVTFDLQTTVVLGGVHVWNLNFYSPYHGRGARDVAILTSLNGTDWADRGTALFAIATGVAGDPGFDLDASGWGEARYVRFDILSNFGLADNAGHVGLSEVRFFRHLASASAAQPTWAWTSGGGGSGVFRVKLDDPDLATGALVTSGVSWSPAVALSHGLHTLYVQERDQAGNWSASGSFSINVLRIYNVTFSTDGTAGASLAGNAAQAVPHGTPATEVTAVAPPAYHFVRWSCLGDAYSTDNPLTVTEVIADLALTADFAPDFLTLEYGAGPHGALAGVTSQTVRPGENGTAVVAVPDFGYAFERWSDGVTDNPRRDANVSAALAVTAVFRAAEATAPDGLFLALVDAAGVAAGRGLWDLTGTYTTTAAGNPLVLNLVHDPRGRVTGAATCTVGKGIAVVMPVRGSVKGASGSITFRGTVKGADPAGEVHVSLTLDLMVDTGNRQLRGRLTGSILAGGRTTPVDDGRTLAIPGNMDGTWSLRLELDQAGRGVAGRAVLTLSNGVDYAFLLQGRAHGTRAVLTLAGDPADPAATAITIKAGITPLTGGWAWFESVSIQAYGQAVLW